MTIASTLSSVCALARVAALAAATVLAGNASAADAPPPSPLRIPAGDYTLDGNAQRRGRWRVGGARVAGEHGRRSERGDARERANG